MGPELDLLIERSVAACASSARLMARSASLARRGIGLVRHGVELTLVADTGAPAAARDAIVDLAVAAGAPEDVVEAVRLTVSEAVSNSVMHAYDPDTPGDVHVSAYLAAGGLHVLVADDGRGPRMPSGNPGLGLGWKLMTQLSDRCTITRRGNGGTMVLMRFCLAHRGFVGGSSAGI